MDTQLKEKIETIIGSGPVVLMMKGTPSFPQCGFSARCVEILKHVDASFESFNILEDMDVRQGIKEYSNWPTFPQLYVNKELVGGCDIMMEMFESGELQQMLPTA